MKALNMYIPDDLLRSFKIETTKEGRSMVSVIREFMSNYVKKKKKRKAA